MPNGHLWHLDSCGSCTDLLICTTDLHSLQQYARLLHTIQIVLQTGRTLSICFVVSMIVSAQPTSGAACLAQTCKNAKHTPLPRSLCTLCARPLKTRRQGRRLQQHHGQCRTKASMGPSMPPATFARLLCLHHCRCNRGVEHWHKQSEKVHLFRSRPGTLT